MEEGQLTKASLPFEQVQSSVTGVQFACCILLVLQILIAALPRAADVSQLLHECANNAHQARWCRANT